MLTYLLLSYPAIIFWAVAFPFSYREAQNNGRIKRVKIATYIAAFILPLATLILLKDGYHIVGYYGVWCIARNPTTYYYVVTVPISATLWIGACLFVMTTWILFKVSCIKLFLVDCRLENMHACSWCKGFCY